MQILNSSSHPNLSDQTSDAELVALAASGETRAFELVMRRYNRLLFRTARSILKQDAEAEDALQEAYLRAWRALHTFRADAKLSTWLVRIVVNESLGRLRKRGAQVLPIDASADLTAHETQSRIAQNANTEPEPVAIEADMRRLIESRIDTLPEVFRTVFVLRAIEELSVEEVAAALEIPEATVRTRYFRARSLLRESLSRDMDVATAEAFSFDGVRCDRIVATVLERLAPPPDASGD